MTVPVISTQDSKYVVGASDTIKTLFTYCQNGVNKTLLYDNSNYQVPVGKKFLILGIQLSGYNVSTNEAVVDLYWSGSPATLTNYWGAISAASNQNNVNWYYEIAAGNYITCKNTYGGVGILSIYGVETNA